MYVQVLDPRAKLPSKGSQFAAGLDLSSLEECTVPAGGTAMIPTGLAIMVPPGTYGRIAPRSGLAAKHSIGVGAGVVDRDYRGHIHVVIFNHDSTRDFHIKAGDRIAQLILEKIVEDPDVVVVAVLPESERGGGGFGSTGT